MATMEQNATGVKGNAGCDKCGIFDRIQGSKYCASCDAAVSGTPKGTKLVRIGDLLNDDEIKRALTCKTAQEIADVVIRPALDRINKATGQENDALYLAYAIQYAVTNGVW